MCKYCKYRDVREWDDGTFEKANNIPRIMRVKDGHQIFELAFNRYTVDEEDHCHHELIFEIVGKEPYTGHEYTLLEKHINIKYCPFCGERL
jgi:hypothetical protein